MWESHWGQCHLDRQVGGAPWRTNVEWSDKPVSLEKIWRKNITGRSKQGQRCWAMSMQGVWPTARSQSTYSRGRGEVCQAKVMIWSLDLCSKDNRELANRWMTQYDWHVYNLHYLSHLILSTDSEEISTQRQRKEDTENLCGESKVHPRAEQSLRRGSLRSQVQHCSLGTSWVQSEINGKDENVDVVFNLPYSK